MSFNNKDRPKKKYRIIQNQTVDDDNSGEKKQPVSEPPITPPVKAPVAKLPTSSNSGVRLRNYDHIIEQLRQSLSTHSRDKQFLSKITKTTGLNKEKINRFIHKKDYNVLTLAAFISLLDTFNLTLVLVPT